MLKTQQNPADTASAGKQTAATRRDRGRNKWFEAALKTLVEEGVAAVVIDRLATRLGITRGSF